MNVDNLKTPLDVNKLIDINGQAAGALWSGNENQYRPALWRSWDTKKGVAVFIGLNPSTADEHKVDNTVRRCINYSKAWGYGSYIMLNIFDYRATKPEVMKMQEHPHSDCMTQILVDVCHMADFVLCAWGTHGAYRNRGREISALLTDNKIVAHCLRTTKAGHPIHPLYQPLDITPVVFDLK